MARPLTSSLVYAVGLTIGLAGSPAARAMDDHGHGSTPAKPAPKAAPAAAKPAPKTGHGAPAPSTTRKPEAKTDAKVADAPGEHSAAGHTGKDAAADGVIETAPAERPRMMSTVSTDVPENPTAEQALKALIDGNNRWVAGNMQDPNVDPSRRAMVSDKGQKPFASILTCADSRLPVERLFDRGVGELFTIRVAGNVAGTSETGTLEYGVGHLKTPLLVVMGHTKCGAVAAAASKAELHGAVGELVAGITPAVERARRNNPTADEQQVLSLAIKENVWQSIFTLIKSSSELREAMAAGKVKVVGAVCDISTGKVEFMGEHPWQVELVDAMNARDKARAVAPATANVETKDEHGH